MRTFDGSSFSAATKVDPYHDPAWKDVDNHLGGTFDGNLPTLYSQMPNITGMVYNAGRLYYTLFGDPTLYSRWFTPDSGIVDERPRPPQAAASASRMRTACSSRTARCTS